jgi:hypothetical protein
MFGPPFEQRSPESEARRARPSSTKRRGSFFNSLLDYEDPQ